MKPPMLELEAAAHRVGCKPGALRRLMSQGRCPGAKVAGRWRIDGDVLEDWLVQQRRSPQASSPTSELPVLEGRYQ